MVRRRQIFPGRPIIRLLVLAGCCLLANADLKEGEVGVFSGHGQRILWRVEKCDMIPQDLDPSNPRKKSFVAVLKIYPDTGYINELRPDTLNLKTHFAEYPELFFYEKTSTEHTLRVSCGKLKVTPNVDWHPVRLNNSGDLAACLKKEIRQLKRKRKRKEKKIRNLTRKFDNRHRSGREMKYAGYWEGDTHARSKTKIRRGQMDKGMFTTHDDLELVRGKLTKQAKERLEKNRILWAAQAKKQKAAEAAERANANRRKEEEFEAAAQKKATDDANRRKFFHNYRIEKQRKEIREREEQEAIARTKNAKHNNQWMVPYNADIAKRRVEEERQKQAAIARIAEFKRVRQLKHEQRQARMAEIERKKREYEANYEVEKSPQPFTHTWEEKRPGNKEKRVHDIVGFSQGTKERSTGKYVKGTLKYRRCFQVISFYKKDNKFTILSIQSDKKYNKGTSRRLTKYRSITNLNETEVLVALAKALQKKYGPTAVENLTDEQVLDKWALGEIELNQIDRDRKEQTPDGNHVMIPGDFFKVTYKGTEPLQKLKLKNIHNDMFV